jgi:hypothetical protein
MQFPLESRVQGSLGLGSRENVAPLSCDDEEGMYVERRHHCRRKHERRGAPHLDALETRGGVERRQDDRRQENTEALGSTN